MSFGEVHLELHGMALAALVGVLANALLPASLNREELDAPPRLRGRETGLSPRPYAWARTSR
ncbi:hypothetical protein [Archangium sp.]|uniref:hypothetical protein n=1 Tax=Archangium sp. TaxID=1872627 RepID=UPI00389B318D